MLCTTWLRTMSLSLGVSFCMTCFPLERFADLRGGSRRFRHGLFSRKLDANKAVALTSHAASSRTERRFSQEAKPVVEVRQVAAENIVQARELYERSAAAGHHFAQNNLGWPGMRLMIGTRPQSLHL